MHNSSRLGFLGGLLLFLSWLAPVGSAHALPFFEGLNLLSDDSATFLINGGDGSICGIKFGECIINEGDRLVGIMNFHRIEQGGASVNIGGGSTFNELTAVFDFQVNAKLDFEGVGAPGEPVIYFLGPTDGATFFADTAVIAPANTTAVFFDDPANDFNRGGTIATGIASATNGTPLWFASGNSKVQTFQYREFPLFIVHGDDIGSLGNLALGTAFGFSNFNMIQLSGGNGPLLGENCRNQALGFPSNFCGNGTLTARDPASQFNAYGQAQVAINVLNNAAAVPESASLLLLGLGLVGLGLWRALKREMRGSCNASLL